MLCQTHCSHTNSLMHPTSQHVEALQRECNESAVEVQRLRDGEGSRLPALLRGPMTIQDELANLKR